MVKFWPTLGSFAEARSLHRETQNSMVLYADLKRWIALEVPKVEDGRSAVAVPPVASPTS